MDQGSTSSKSVLEIACDESGYEGMRLVGGMTSVFAHASVTLDQEFSASCIAELRSRIRSPAVEYKANHLLRARHRGALIWFLGPGGPVHGKSWVHLTEKPFLLLLKTLDSLAPSRDVVEMARLLYRVGGEAGEGWDRFLVASNAWLRAKDPASAEASLLHLKEQMGQVTSLLPSDSADAVAEMGRMLRAGATERPDVGADAGQLRLDPLLAAIFRGVAHWSRSGRPIAVIHDRQNTLTSARIALLAEMLELSSLQMDSFSLVDSRADPRVQMADFLAGVARRIAEDELSGRGDPELDELLRPYVDPASVWDDPRSWNRFGPV